MKPKSPLVFLAFAVALAVAAIALSPARNDRHASGGPAVAATLFPVYDIVRNVAGDAVDVRLLLPPGASPHTFEPSPSTLRALDGADVVYAVGHGLDGWADRLAVTSGADVMTLKAGVALHASDGDHGGGDDHGDEGVDPHYWLAVENARKMARNAASDLASRFPDHAGDFAVNLAAYERRLDEVRTEMHGLLSGLRNRSLVTMHDAWYYFSEENGLDLVATVTTSPGKELTPQQLAALSRAVTERDVSTIYSEPQLSTAPIAAFAEDLGVTIAVLDPLGGTEDDGSYAELMLHNARIVAENQR